MKLASKTATTLASEGKIVVKAPKLIMTTNGKGAVMVAGKKGFLIGKEKAVVGSNDKTVVRGKNRVDIESKSGEIHMNAKTPIFISACSDGSKIQMQGHGIAIEKKGGGRASFGNGGVYLSGKQVKAKGKCIFG